MTKIFISYARKDGSEIARLLASRLRGELNHEVFLDVENIVGGRWRSQIQQWIDESDLFILLVTPFSNKSDNVFEEVDRAEQQGKLIILVPVGDSELPVYLRSTWQAIRLNDNNLDAVLLQIERTTKDLNPMEKIPKKDNSFNIFGISPIQLIVILQFIVVRRKNWNTQ